MLNLPRHRLYSLELLHQGFMTVALAVTPLITGIIAIGLLIALIQGAFQIEDGALAMAAKLGVVFLLASSGGVAIYLTMQHLAGDWIAHIPEMIDRPWS
ncbi:flagellar biosynthetic protein FliQ [Acidiphilium acidophilum]|uniref:flagellar biosynthetic protein FliQ n=1 Tax=Acidiphilium acidophilum TaxID=76588 RepID=UPI002E8E7223|nr:flagellar biosynthetic protein FliQ [Acidiphilium acidophilum]